MAVTRTYSHVFLIVGVVAIVLYSRDARALESFRTRSGFVPAQPILNSGRLPANLDPLVVEATAAMALTASPPPPLLPKVSSPPPGKPCPAGCELRGTCNRELGVCDCPPMTSGPACEDSAAPLCSRQWGLELPIPPCQALSTELGDFLDFPPACECLAECQALLHRATHHVPPPSATHVLPADAVIGYRLGRLSTSASSTWLTA